MPRKGIKGRSKRNDGRVQFRKVYPSRKKEPPGSEPAQPDHACGAPQQCVLQPWECDLLASQRSAWDDMA